MMSGSRTKGKVSGYSYMPRSMRSTRTKKVLADPAKKSSSAVSSRTYSRMANIRFAESHTNGATNNTFSGNDDSLPLNESYADLEELKNEKELLDRMLDQQRQLQELKERQKRVLLLQQQLADVEASAEESLEEKLDKLQTAKSRLDELQQLVSTIKLAEMTGKGEGDRRQQNIPDKATRVRKALQELNELKDVIGMMSVGSDAKETAHGKPAVTLEPVFPNAVREDDYHPVLPEVSIIQPEKMEDSPAQSSLKSPKRRSKDLSQHSPSTFLPYYKPKQTPLAKKETGRAVSKSPEKEPEDLEGTLRLVDEMRRHQKLLQELKDRRKELEMLMNMTNGSEQAKLTAEDEFNDTDASIKSNDGSDDESQSVSDEDTSELKVNHSGQLFGLSDINTRRVIDLIRNQKGVMAGATDKTTATWGSSTSGSDDDDDQMRYLPESRIKKKTVPKSYNESARSTSVKDAFTQINHGKEHEIDFRPPTRRRRNITQSEIKNKSFAGSYGEIDINSVQDELHASNSAMHILLEDQQALSKLLLNTLALQQSSVSSKMCYGISPDFLIYQLDNCSAQLAAILKETKDIQWQLYNMTKETDTVEKIESGPAPRNPLATLPHVLNQQYMSYMEPSAVDSFQLQMPSSPNDVPAQNISLLGDSSCTQPNVVRNGYTKAQKEVEDAEADLFEALRDSIYSEAAILISQNESRPHFLVELFHTLQQLNTDYLRQHALYVLQDVVKGYLSNSPRRVEKPGKRKYVEDSKKIRTRASFSENTPSENGASSEEEAYEDMKEKPSDASQYDFVLKVSSASDLSSPSDDDVTPFAADDLGSTVIHLDAALRHMREVERWKQEIKSSDSTAASPGNAKKIGIPSVNSKLLRVWIKNIVSEIIPILKANHDKMVDKKLVKKMHKKVFQCVSKDITGENLGKGEAMELDKVGMGEFFASQLKSIVDDCFSKFIGQTVGSCGEDVIVGLSEVLFNELAFFYMMQDLGKENRVVTDGGGDISGVVENPKQKTDIAEYNPSSGTSTKDDEKIEDSEASNGDEGGVVVGDANQNASSRASPDPVTFDLSVSETKPLTSYGSGEDEEDGSGEDYDYKEPEVCTSMQKNSDSSMKLDENSQDQEACPKLEAPNSE